MRARGVAFAAESIASLDIDEELADKTFTKLERVWSCPVKVRRLIDFIIHKSLSSEDRRKILGILVAFKNSAKLGKEAVSYTHR